MIFRAYDIRGVFPSELSEDFAYKIGRAFVIFLKAKEVIVGRDGRLSSPQLSKALSHGIIDEGANVIDLGLCSSPMFYFASRHASASVMVTASHNPKEYNGFKLCGKEALSLSYEAGIKKIKDLINENNFPQIRKRGKVIKKDVLQEYVRYNNNFVKVNKKFKRTLKIVLDAGNGMAGYTFPKIFSQLKDIKLVELYTNLDFSFPNHIPNPLRYETLKDLQKKVKSEQADFGIATDGDADRVVFIDERGRIIPSDILVALLSKYFLEQQKGATILYDVRCSRIVKETIEKYGGKGIISRVGHSYINGQMKKKKAIFAGELSGHLYYKENNYTESPFITTAHLINMLFQSSQSLSEQVSPFQKYFATGEINFKIADSEMKMKDIEKKYKREAKKILHLDGLSMYFTNWWFNLRKSHTEDLLRLNLEANSVELMKEKKREILQLIKG